MPIVALINDFKSIREAALRIPQLAV